MKQNKQIYATVFVASFVSLSFEITLTRIFSISLWYHFAFMVITIAMMGLALSGTILSLFPKLKSFSNLSLYGFFLGTSITAGYLIANQIPFDPVKFQWSKAHLMLIGLYYLVLIIPFLFTGLIIASGYHLISDKSGILYGFDLMGAGIGSLGIILLLQNFAPERVILFLSVITLMAIPMKGKKNLKIVAGFFCLIIAFMMISPPPFVIPSISAFKEMSQALRYPGSRHVRTQHDSFSRIDIFESPAVRYAPGLSLKYQHALPRQLGCSIDGDQIMAITDANKKNELAFLTQLPQSLAFEIAERKDALLIDPRGGLVSLMAQYYRVDNIFNVESLPLLVEVLQKDQARFSGHIYTRNTWKGMGRAWLKARSRMFDIIDMTLTGSIPSGPSGLSEDYQLTVEAFQEYLSHLKPDGFLSLSLYLVPPPRHSFRLLNTMVAAMKKSGIPNPGRHIAAIRSWSTMTLLLKKSPFQVSEIKKTKNFAKSRLFDLVYCPGIQARETGQFIKTQDNMYYSGFKKLVSPEKQADYMNQYIFDISPVYDDRPFFYYFLKFRNLNKIYHLVGEKWDFFLREGILLPFIFIQIVLFSIVLIALPFISGPKPKAQDNYIRETRPMGIYFALLGLGFMFVEIVLIQKLILVLIHSHFLSLSYLLLLPLTCETRTHNMEKQC